MNCIKYFRLLFISLFCFISTIAHSFEVDGINYSITSGTTVSVASNKNCSGAIIIPEKVTYNGYEYSVTSIEKNAFYGCSGLTSVTIPNSMTNIGDDAFRGCSGLTAVHINDLSAWCKINFVGWYSSNPTYYAHHLYLNGNEIINLVIPDDVTSIGDYAFRGCSGITSITIPNSITSIGSGAFDGCDGLTAVYITDMYAWCKIKFSDSSSNPTYYAHHLYLNGEEITNLVIPDDVTSIGNHAFRGCSGITSVTIPNSVTSIGYAAFKGCSGLTSITIPNSVTSIGNEIFFDCSSITSVTIPNSVTSIGVLAFGGCSGLTAVHITDLSAWCKIKFDDDFGGDRDFQCNPTYYAHHLYLNGEEITNLVIPDDVTSIGDVAFASCFGLTSVTIPNSVTSIGEAAFYGCSGLTSVTIGNSVTNIGECAFQKCSGLTSVTIPNSVTSIGDMTFYNCSGLTSVTIPNSVTSIGSSAFNNCKGLTAVHITDLSAWYKITFGDEYANPMYSSSKEVTYVNDMELTDLNIPDSITAIHEYAFIGCNSLRRLTISESCKTVQKYAFRDCNNLQELTLPSTCIACYDYSFNGCTSLKKINCQAETPPAVYANTFSSSIYTKATLNVPEGCADKYKAANIWKEFTNMTVGGVVPDEPKQCAAPVITYADGKLQFACETEGAEYRYTLTDSDIKSVYTDVTNSAVNLSACYTIKAYAYAEGYTNSEQVTATLYWINGSDVSTNINQTEMRGVMATYSGGIITVSGLSDGETVMFYDANGALLYTGTAQKGTISYAPSASGVIIVKIGTTSIKVVK